MKKLFCFFWIAYCFTACFKKSQVSDFPVIDILGSISNYQKVYCSELFSSIELIPLETKDECLLAVPNLGNGVLMNDDYILVSYTFFNNARLYAFNRKGEFLNAIGQKGQGPGEYVGISSMFFNLNKPTVYVEEIGKKMLEYDFHGKFIRSIPIPNVEGQRLWSISDVGDGLFVGHRSNYGKNEANYYSYFNTLKKI